MTTIETVGERHAPISPQPVTGSPRRLVPIMAAVAVASFLLPLAVTAPAVGLAEYARGLGASTTQTQWVQDGYNAMFAATVLAAGGFADRFGRRHVLAGGAALFGTCSLAIGLLSSPGAVVALRIVQGFGAGGILAAGGALLASVATGPSRTTAFGVLGASFGTGLALGPVLAGVLDHWGWRASYLFIAVLAFASLAAVLRFAPNTTGDRSRSTDVRGIVTFAVAIMALSVALVVGASAGWGAPATVAAFALTLLSGTAFVLVELRSREPLFDVRLLRNREFTTVMCQPFTITFGFVILLVYLPAFLQSTTGMGSLAAALCLLPLTLPVMLIPPFAGALTRRYSVKVLLVAGSVLITAGSIALAAALRSHGAELTVWPGLLVFGTGVGVAFAVMDNAAITSVPTEQAGTASGMFNTVRITGESVAISGAGALLLTLTRAGGFGDHPIPARSAAAALQGLVTPSAADNLTLALRITLLVVAALAALGSAVSARNLVHRPTTHRPTTDTKEVTA